ncbi:MAG: DEAD/DEAH box helicase family protein, partial [Actinomycetales bacterium]|nr:DEAD/DEAH box helicase family protein [Actinomycetales bacterium]
MKIETASVWASQVAVAGNPVRQLLVPAGTLVVERSGSGTEGAAHNRFGCWSTTSLSAGDLPLSLRVTPTLNSRSRAEWVGDRSLVDADRVVASWEGALTIRRPGTEGSLRRPQAGALHAVLGHLLSGVDVPGLVVMPTGTGKTETMLAVTVAAGLERLLVVVPSISLREQVCDKFL